MKYLLTFLLFTTLQAGLINGIALTVNEEPITLYDIDTYAQQLRITQAQATMELIKKVLTKQLAKEKNIFVEKAEIEAQIKEIELKNSLTTEAFDQQLALQGLTRAMLFEQFEYQQLQQRLIGMITYGKIHEPTIEEKNTYYALHKEQFGMPKSITLIEYRSPNQNSLASIKRSPLFSPQDVHEEEKTLPTHDMNPQLLKLLLGTKEGYFTDILPMGERMFGMFYVRSLGEVAIPAFEQLEKQLTQIIQAEKRNTLIENFFTDEIRKATIKYLRVDPVTQML